MSTKSFAVVFIRPDGIPRTAVGKFASRQEAHAWAAAARRLRPRGEGKHVVLLLEAP